MCKCFFSAGVFIPYSSDGGVDARYCFMSPQVLAEVTGTVSEALVGFRQQCMDNLSSYMSGKSGKVAVDASEDAFADDEEVEEDGVAAYLKGKKSKKQKT